MSELADRLEWAVERWRAMEALEGYSSLRRDRAFLGMLNLLEPRIARLTRSYGLADMSDDAWQACAIGLIRALDSYDPERARFTTHATWAMRGELQSLRHRVRLDQRQGARSAGVKTVPLEWPNGFSAERPFEIIDEDALERSQRAVADGWVERSMRRLFDRLGSPDEERAIVHAALFDLPMPSSASGRTGEQCRQITRRTLRNCAKLVGLSEVSLH